MTSSSADVAAAERRVRRLGGAGPGLLHAGLVFLHVKSGSRTCLAFAAEGRVPHPPCGKAAASHHGGDRS
jgi:hypothetical protein